MFGLMRGIAWALLAALVVGAWLAYLTVGASLGIMVASTALALGAGILSLEMAHWGRRVLALLRLLHL